MTAGTTERPRARELGIPLDGLPGHLNAITDVAGVTVGEVTLIDGDGPLRVGDGPVRTGVTAILPRGRAGIGRPCAAGWFSLNGNGEMTGTTWITESGVLTMPVLITSTHSVGPCHAGVIAWCVANRPELARRWLLPVVAETWDGYLNDTGGGHVRPEHAMAAIDKAAESLHRPPREGGVGGGTGMTLYGFKGGSGTSSRRVRIGSSEYHVGVFVQANFGARRELTVAGCPIGRCLPHDNPVEQVPDELPPGAGSVIAVVATDAPLLPGQAHALARRVPLGLARTGTTGSHFSGDIFIAFSTANAEPLTALIGAGSAPASGIEAIPWSSIDPVYEGVVQATEEAVLNALVAGETMIGIDGHRVPGLPHDEVRALLGPALAYRSIS